MLDPPGRREKLHVHVKRVEGATRRPQNQKTLKILQFSLFLMILRVGRERRLHGHTIGEEALLQQPVLEEQKFNLPNKSRPQKSPLASTITSQRAQPLCPERCLPLPDPKPPRAGGGDW